MSTSSPFVIWICIVYHENSFHSNSSQTQRRRFEEETFVARPFAVETEIEGNFTTFHRNHRHQSIQSVDPVEIGHLVGNWFHCIQFAEETGSHATSRWNLIASCTSLIIWSKQLGTKCSQRWSIRTYLGSIWPKSSLQCLLFGRIVGQRQCIIGFVAHIQTIHHCLNARKASTVVHWMRFIYFVFIHKPKEKNTKHTHTHKRYLFIEHEKQI